MEMHRRHTEVLDAVLGDGPPGSGLVSLREGQDLSIGGPDCRRLSFAGVQGLSRGGGAHPPLAARRPTRATCFDQMNESQGHVPLCADTSRATAQLSTSIACLYGHRAAR